MATVPPPARTALADTYPLPSNATFKTGIGALWDYVTNLLGTVGSPATARAALGIATPTGKNYVRNGSFAVYQRGAFPTADNSFGLDGWRLLLGAANAATWTRDTADVPAGAGYASVLTVGSGNNNKFGIFQPVPNRDILDARGAVMSIRVALKATAGLVDGTGKIRIGIMQWTGTADAISGDPISAWGSEGTNPTLAAGWAFANTPAALSVTTSWVDYLVENVSISASATNLGILIWSDDATNTQTTDILRIGGYVTMCQGATAPLAQVAEYQDELRRCTPHYRVFAQMNGNAASATVAQFALSWSDEMMGTISGASLDTTVDLAVLGSTSNITGTWSFGTQGAYGAGLNFTRTSGTWAAGNSVAVNQNTAVVAYSNGIF